MTAREGNGPEQNEALMRHVFGGSGRTFPDLDPANAELIQRYVLWDQKEPRYLKLGGRLSKRSNRFQRALGEDAREISDEALDRLLACGWRPRLTAAWLIGVDARNRYRQKLGELLLDSEVIYAGQGYCFALARFGQHEDAEILSAYLDHYLPRTDCHYDQHWAMGALLYLDGRLGTRAADRYLTTGLWQSSSFARLDPHAYQRGITESCADAVTITAEDAG
ncbi:DUF6000 family protein [Actinomadura macrotermitis]|uniref:Uncharacterized protein n=1 Tax=Actinomadura macrotermitis TaxID=2585200 RepID=A0A7K0C4S6_9ACTN|nr:DUF6000 family protein [Actinomadura macrotermitis]MQY08439.1 hypothetical protein [Actinomadura macrotermitis]